MCFHAAITYTATFNEAATAKVALSVSACLSTARRDPRAIMSHETRGMKSEYDEVIRSAARQKGPFDSVTLFDALRADRGCLSDNRLRVCVRFLGTAGDLRHERFRFEPVAKGVGLFDRAAKHGWDRANRTERVQILRIDLTRWLNVIIFTCIESLG